MGTQWDDQPIRPDHFQKLEKNEQTGQNEGVLAEISERKQESEKQDNEQQKNEKQENEQQKNKKQDNEQQKNKKQENEQQQEGEARKESKGRDLQAESIQEEAEESPALFPDCDQCWRICPGDLRQICRKNCVYCNNRFSMDTVISDIFCCAGRQTGSTYWGCQASMTSKSVSWQRCLDSPGLRNGLYLE